jgi:hypothetical protein
LLLRDGDENGRHETLRATWIVLAVAVPLIPLQPFGIVLTIFSLLNLAALKLLLRKHDISPQADDEKTLLPVPSLGLNG